MSKDSRSTFFLEAFRHRPWLISSRQVFVKFYFKIVLDSARLSTPKTDAVMFRGALQFILVWTVEEASRLKQSKVDLSQKTEVENKKTS